MDKVKQLIIRACKSNNPELRLKTLYRRFYLLNADDDTMHFSMAGILASICDEYLTIKTSRMVSDLCPGNRRKFGIEDGDNYWQSMVKVLTSYIRLSDKESFPGLTPPVMFRQDQPEDSDLNLETNSENEEPWANPIIISDEDEIWQITGALDQACEDGADKLMAQSETIRALIPNWNRPFQSLSDTFFHQRTEDGELEIRSDAQAAILLYALRHVDHRMGFRGIDWVFEPSSDIIRNYIRELTFVLKTKHPEIV